MMEHVPVKVTPVWRCEAATVEQGGKRPCDTTHTKIASGGEDGISCDTLCTGKLPNIPSRPPTSSRRSIGLVPCGYSPVSQPARARPSLPRMRVVGDREDLLSSYLTLSPVPTVAPQERRCRPTNKPT